mgnify:CR=1 FL=1
MLYFPNKFGNRISTHSLTKRLTRIVGYWCESDYYFNSQPHEEADYRWSCSDGTGWYFNSQPHEEADIRELEGKLNGNYFNSQPHEEADVDLITDKGAILKFQLTASRRG